MVKIEKLTYVTQDGEVLFTPPDYEEDKGATITALANSGYFDFLEQIADTLANTEQRLERYYDTGLTPDQIHNQKHNLGIAYNIISGYEQCIREIFGQQQEHNGRQYIDAEEAAGIIDKIMSGRLKELRDDIDRFKP